MIGHLRFHRFGHLCGHGGALILCGQNAHRNAQAIRNEIDGLVHIDRHLTGGTDLLGELHELQNAFELFAVLGLGEWRDRRDLYLLAIDAKRHVDQILLVHDIEDACNNR